MERLGVIRATRFVEILLSTGVCRSLPFGVVIAVRLVLTILVGLLLRNLLRHPDIPPPWADVGAALWLLQPLGSEAALWPAAVHVPLGLALALGSLLLFRRGRTVSATVAAAAALLSVEQLILALRLAAWLVAPPDRRTRSAGLAGAVTGVALVAFLLSWVPQLRWRIVHGILGVTCGNVGLYAHTACI